MIAAGTDAGATWLLAMLTISTVPVLVAGAHGLITLDRGPLPART